MYNKSNNVEDHIFKLMIQNTFLNLAISQNGHPEMYDNYSRYICLLDVWRHSNLYNRRSVEQCDRVSCRRMLFWTLRHAHTDSLTHSQFWQRSSCNREI